MTADHLPFEVFHETGEFLLYLLCGELALIDVDKPALEESLGDLDVGLVKEVLSYIGTKTVISVLLMTNLDALYDLLLELLLSGDLALAEHLVPGFLVGLCCNKGLDVDHGKLKHGIQVCKLGLIDLKHCRAVCLIRESGVDIDGELVPSLLADESSAGFLCHLLDGDIYALCLVPFVGDIGYDIIVLTGFLAFLEAAVLLEHLLTGSLLLGLGYVDVVVDNLIVLGHGEIDFRGLGDIELEGEVRTLFPGQLGLVFRRKWLTHDADLVILDKLVKLFRQDSINALVQSLLSIKTLDHSNGSHSLAESLDVRLALVLVEALTQRLLIICSCNLYCHLIVQCIRLFFR